MTAQKFEVYQTLKVPLYCVMILGIFDLKNEMFMDILLITSELQ